VWFFGGRRLLRPCGAYRSIGKRTERGGRKRKAGEPFNGRSEVRLAVSLYLEGGSTGPGSRLPETKDSVKVSAKESPRARSSQGPGGASVKPALGTEAPIQSNPISRYVG
jgi:hypothetical protein